MDKYTVDLDKLLNDFEYNELTDPQDTTTTKLTDISQQNVKLNNQLPTTSLNGKNSNTKHSITNVFHSLNEYLSTDISSVTKKLDTVCINNTLDREEHKAVNVTHPKVNNNDLKLTDVIDNNTKKSVQSMNELCESYEEIADEKRLEEEVSLLEDAVLKDNLKNNKEDVSAEAVNIAEVKDNSVMPELKNRNEESSDDVNLDIVNYDVKHLDIAIEKSDKSCAEDLKCFIQSKSNEEHSTDSDEPIPEKINEIVVELNTKIDDKVFELTEVKPLCFDTVKIDDSDLDKYLDEIENEYDKNQQSKEINNKLQEFAISKYDNQPEVKNVEVINMKQADVIKNYKEEGNDKIMQEDNGEEDDDEVIKQKDEIRGDGKVIQEDRVIEAVGSYKCQVEVIQPEKTDTRVVNLEQNEELQEEEVTEDVMQDENKPNEMLQNILESNQIENVEEKTVLAKGDVIAKADVIAKVDVAAKSDDDKEELIDSDVVNKELNENDECRTLDTENELNQSKEEKHVPSSNNNGDRPTSLELETSDNKREIDLIGSPGSTPYNNVYLSKEESSGSDITSTTLTDSDDSAGIESDDSENIVKNKERLKSKRDVTTSVKNNPSDNPTDAGDPSVWLGKQPPFWMPDSQAPTCQQCDINFTFIKRRHHCRACGLVLCSKCCNMKYLLSYLDMEARVCQKCYSILSQHGDNSEDAEAAGTSTSGNNNNTIQPKPNNPMEYCSVVPPHQQVSNSSPNPPSVMVPVGVLKRKGSAKSKSNKSVMFCDGIRPGSDLTNLDADFNYSQQISSNSQQQQQQQQQQQHQKVQRKHNNSKSFPTIEHETKSFIPALENSLPPTVNIYKSEVTYTECGNNTGIVEMLKNEMLTFAVNKNLLVHVKVINMNCCINKTAWCFTTEGLIAVGQDEVVYLIECVENEKLVPKDIFYHINNIYCDAVKGTTVTELGLSLHNKSIFFDSKNHSGFLYIRPTLQCLQNVILPSEPYLIGLLIHRWECPWAKIFPLRLILRLGAEYRYYPSPIISTRDRDSVFVEIGHTIINLLADFKNFSYTIPNIRGLTIHMEDKNTTVTIPSNRYDQVMKTLNNSSDHILAFGGNFSMDADSHLVCIQDTQGSTENNYTTHAININNKPRKITGASFIVFNGALKSSSGLTAKSSIVEDGLMIQIPPEHMVQVRDNLKNMKNHTIQCGCINAVSDELVKIVWGDPDVHFNIGVTSPIDKQTLNGVPSIRVHNGKDYACHSGSRIIRWTEVFILQNGDELTKGQQDPVDISKVAESISKATCSALVKYLDLLASNNFYKIGIRTTLQMDNVSYSAGSNGIKLPPIYMKSLDNELIPVLHRITSNNITDNPIILELIFRILSL